MTGFFVERLCSKPHLSDREGNFENAETTCSNYQTLSNKQS